MRRIINTNKAWDLLNHTGKGGRIASLRVVSNRHDQKTYEGGNNFSLYSTFKGSTQERKKATKNAKITQQKTYNCTYTYIRPPFWGTRVVEVENIYHQVLPWFNTL